VKVCNQRHEQPEERQRVVAWRIDRLRDAGFPAGLATALARDTRYDVHALLELADRGCTPNLAARILCPLDDDCESGR
jgi:hypothetical protein